MTYQYAVIGNPIAHSKSPLIHRMFAEQTGQDVSYEAIEAPLDGFAATINRLRHSGCNGCNVTVPFKFEAFQLAAELSERARSAQAVNTLSFEGDIIRGDNTDGAGLVRDIEQNLGFSLPKKRVLLMGAGGAAYGVALPVVMAGAQLTVYNRTPAKAERLAAHLAEHSHVDILNSLADKAGMAFDCVVNATSAGLTDSKIPLPASIFAPGALAYDMMYGRETPFMRFAREQGAAIVSDGLGMLVEQAAESFYLWRGVRPDTRPVLEKLRMA